MLTKNPPFTKSMESPLCNEALVDQLWKLMNSGKRAVAFKKAFYYWSFSFYCFFFKETAYRTCLYSGGCDNIC